ncbi:ArsC family reductase [Microbulbifer hydrolyticus]|uniref:ArsC family reductase n=1 Tax=Microbulbifer hydrolyticus TaxID=48074 RepID=A0A6P1TFH4_9GAMM|nr:ArsC family reductase [Microbulbifer hydrolyticus]MBB5209932.1 Spx/MgsR family transcriptional regulator [Microbulbifer hydrolyticus]QHQ39532.1 ArsC family reductase [Microbulbifer hydrolyticus]
MITVYGIKNCDTVKKARKWLEQNNVEYRFHDFREDGMNAVPLTQWIEEFGWEQVLNRRSTSWRALSDAQKTEMSNGSAAALASETPTLIKRPVMTKGDSTLFGFKADSYASFVK